MLDAVTGVRRSELLGFCWDANRFGRGHLSRRAEGRGGSPILIIPTLQNDLKTDHAYRSGRLPAAAVRILARAQKGQSEQRLKAGSAWSDHSLLFPDPLGYPLHPKPSPAVCGGYKSGQGLDAIGIHALRHYVATALINGHVDEATIAQIMGHGNSAYTRRQYEGCI